MIKQQGAPRPFFSFFPAWEYDVARSGSDVGPRDHVAKSGWADIFVQGPQHLMYS